MPFDGATPKRTSEQQANLLELIHDLRNLPEDWEWDYGANCRCAQGRLWHLHQAYAAQHQDGSPQMQFMTARASAAVLGLSYEQCVSAFLSGPDYRTPHDVAGILEGYL